MSTFVDERSMSALEYRLVLILLLNKNSSLVNTFMKRKISLRITQIRYFLWIMSLTHSLFTTLRVMSKHEHTMPVEANTRYLFETYESSRRTCMY